MSHWHATFSEFHAKHAHLHTTHHHHSLIFYFLVIILSPTFIGFNSNPNQTNKLRYLTSRNNGFAPQKHTLTTKQPNTQETTITMVTSACRSLVASILKVSKIALRHTINNDLCNTVMQILHVQLTFPLFFYYYSTRRGSARSQTNCEFLLLLLTLFLGRCVGTKRTNHSC